MSARAEPHCVTLELFDNPTSLIYGIGNDGRRIGLGLHRPARANPSSASRMPAPYLSAEPRRRRSDQPIYASVVRGCHERPCGQILHRELSGAEAGLQLHLTRNLSAVNPGDHPAVLRVRPRRLLAGDPRLRMGTPAGTDQPRATQPQPLTGMLVDTAVALAAAVSLSTAAEIRLPLRWIALHCSPRAPAAVTQA